MSYNPAAEVRLQADIAGFVGDPMGYVMYNFPWDEERVLHVVAMPKYYQDLYQREFGPDEWAIDFLNQWGEEIKKRAFNGTDAVDPIQFSTASGHGIGKSALSAWICKFILDTRPGSRGTVTANTVEQLKTKTWAQVGFWHRLSLTRHWFNFSAGRGAMMLSSTMRDKHGQSLAQEWFCSAQTCRAENSEAFAGQHAPTATSFYLFDEASGVPDPIYKVREGGLTDGEPMTFDFGNPTQNTGQFFQNTAGNKKHNYIVRAIDGRDVKITNKKLYKRWERDYGVESDFFKVRARGLFPSQGSTQFMSGAKVATAMRRELPYIDKYTPLVLGVDVGRHGDDETVIYPRRGLDARSFKIHRLRERDTVQVTEFIKKVFDEYAEDGIAPVAIFVDQGNFGIGIVDSLDHAGYPVTGVNFGGSPMDPMTYKHRVDEMWGDMRKDINRGLCLPEPMNPDASDLEVQLTQRLFGYTLNTELIQLEKKKEMKKRLGADGGSPDIADALCLTYAEAMAGFRDLARNMKPDQVISDFDPARPPLQSAGEQVTSDFDPAHPPLGVSK